MIPMVGWIMNPKDVHVWIPEIMTMFFYIEKGTLQVWLAFEDGSLQMGRICWIFWVCATSSQRSSQREAEGLESGVEDITLEARGWSDSRKGPSQGIQTASRSWKGKNVFSPFKPPEGAESCWHFIFKNIYLFIFGSAGSWLLLRDFPSLQRAGVTFSLQCSVFS